MKGFVNVVRKGKKMEMSTMELKKRNARILESEQEILLMRCVLPSAFFFLHVERNAPL